MRSFDITDLAIALAAAALVYVSFYPSTAGATNRHWKGGEDLGPSKTMPAGTPDRLEDIRYIPAEQYIRVMTCSNAGTRSECTVRIVPMGGQQ